MTTKTASGAMIRRTAGSPRTSRAGRSGCRPDQASNTRSSRSLKAGTLLSRRTTGVPGQTLTDRAQARSLGLTPGHDRASASVTHKQFPLSEPEPQGGDAEEREETDDVGDRGHERARGHRRIDAEAD